MSRFQRPWAVALVSAYLVVVSAAVPGPAQAASVLNVPADYPTIQAAIDAAAPGDTVLVAPGTYLERITIDAKEITVESSGGPEVTTIDAQQGGTTASIYASPGEIPVLRGFTITGGYGGASGDGGIALGDGPALVEGNWIVDNLGSGIGAYGSAATISGNIIARNRTTGSGYRGGGINVGGVGTVKILGNEIVDNEADQGGGINLGAAGTPTIDGNVIRGNQGGRGGGGIALFNLSDATITNNLIEANFAFAGGGIHWSVGLGDRGPWVANNTLAKNGALHGSAIFAEGYDAGSVLLNNAIGASTTSPAIECDGLNDPNPPIILSNDVVNSDGPRYGGICLDMTGTDGNVSVDPGFVDPDNGDYHLRSDSALIDAGRNADAPSIDFDGDTRPLDGDGDGEAVVDIGFDEVTEAPPNQLPIGTHDGSSETVADRDACYANGWANDPDDPSSDVTVRVLADGDAIWTGLADQFRQDLLDAGIDDGTAAFWVSLVDRISPDVPHEIRAQAQDLQTGEWVDLSATPRTITCINVDPEGFHEGSGELVASGWGCYAAGWAIDPNHPLTDVTIRLTSDGEVVWSGPAGEFRQDLLDAGVSDGTAAFWVDLTDLIGTGAPHEIRAQAQDLDTGAWVDLQETPRTITCTNLFGYVDGNAGSLDREACIAEGWAYDADTPDGKRVEVRVLVDGKVAAETTADEFRPDVRDAGYGDGYSGWSVRLFGKATPFREHVITVEIRDTTAKRIWLPIEPELALTCSPK